MPPSDRIPRLTVTVPEEAFEPVSAYLRAHCGDALEVVDHETLAQGGRGGPLEEGTARALAYPPPDRVFPVVQGLRRLVGELRRDGQLRGPTYIDLDEERGFWSEGPRVLRVAGRFCVTQPWVDYAGGPGEVVLPLDAGDAFGDGRHPSTALALRQLDRLDRQGARPERVLDVGCGTGVLSLAVARLWPDSTVVAVDLDPAAVQACRANVARLELSDRVDVRQQSADAATEPFPLVLANLTAGAIAALAPALAAAVAEEGHLVIAGFVGSVLDDVERTLIGFRLFAVQADEMEGWHALTLCKKAKP